MLLTHVAVPSSIDARKSTLQANNTVGTKPANNTSTPTKVTAHLSQLHHPSHNSDYTNANAPINARSRTPTPACQNACRAPIPIPKTPKASNKPHPTNSS